LISFQFDPDYVRNGRFYTIHLEDPQKPGSDAPDNTVFPGLKVEGYKATAPIRTPGRIDREAVLIEWTDTSIANTTFEGSARELMRVQLNSRIHPMGDMIFNPTARPGDADWRVMYVSCGDGGSGEQNSEIRSSPQRLDTAVGKILRIIPDLGEHKDSSTVSENGRYRIPHDNPFVAVEGARKEIWAYGLRNPHRLTWDVDPDTPANNHLLAAVIGLHSWETVVVVRKGANYGYSEREGTERLTADNSKEKIPDDDRIAVQVTDTVTNGTVAPTYPVIAYRHAPGGGDAIAGGFVYRGRAVPALRGKYIFGDISTGRIWYADYAEMLAADDGKADTLAPMHELQIQWDNTAAEAAKQPYPTMFPIVLAAYRARGGKDPDLPGGSVVSGTGRADIRFAVDGAGELYILSKSDGMIRAISSTATAPSARN
jgi:glucose/sorbosone dehydrogenase